MTVDNQSISGPRLGLYEKALPPELSWEERLSAAREAGFDYIELSIDESEERMARLDWSASERTAVRRAVENSGVDLLTMCLSAVRRYPLGSASPQTRSVSVDLHRKAVDLAADLGIRIIQVSGYDVFYEPRDKGTGDRFVEGMDLAAQWAGRTAVMLGLENVDAPVIDSMNKALALVRKINSPWVHLYPDIGNLAAAGNPPQTELLLTEGRLLAVHVKDARPGQIRGVPFNQGVVPFKDAFLALKKIRFAGPLTVEMWSDRMDGADPIEAARNACRFIGRIWNEADQSGRA